MMQSIDVGERPVHVVPLDGPYLPVIIADRNPQSLGIFSFSSSESIPGPRICTLQLPDLRPGERLGWCDLVVSQLPHKSEGHFRADPEHRMIALTRRILGPDCNYTSVLLIPCAALRAQMSAAMSAQGVTSRAPSNSGALPPVPIVPWRDWGPPACLHLRSEVRPAGQRTPAMITMLPFGSRMPLVVSTNTSPIRASICVVDINPLAARYANSILRRTVTARDSADESPEAPKAIVAPEDMERVLPGVTVDPECSAIPHAIYRFELPVSPTQRPLGHTIRRVQMNMTGFTVTVSSACSSFSVWI